MCCFLVVCLFACCLFLLVLLLLAPAAVVVVVSLDCCIYIFLPRRFSFWRPSQFSAPALAQGRWADCSSRQSFPAGVSGHKTFPWGWLKVRGPCVAGWWKETIYHCRAFPHLGNAKAGVPACRQKLSYVWKTSRTTQCWDMLCVWWVFLCLSPPHVWGHSFEILVYLLLQFHVFTIYWSEKYVLYINEQSLTVIFRWEGESTSQNLNQAYHHLGSLRKGQVFIDDVAFFVKHLLKCTLLQVDMEPKTTYV